MPGEDSHLYVFFVSETRWPAQSFSSDHAHSMRFAVADEDCAVGVYKDAMRAGHFAFERVAIGAIALVASAGDEIKFAGLKIDHTDGVAFGVGEVDISIRGDCDPLGSGERGSLGGAAISGEAFFAGAGNVMDGRGFHIDLVDGVAFAQGEVHVACFIEIDRAGAKEGGAFELGAILRRPLRAGAGEGGEDAGPGVDFSRLIREGRPGFSASPAAAPAVPPKS